MKKDWIRMKRVAGSLVLVCSVLGMIALPTGLYAQNQQESNFKPEFGFWLGASNPFPGTRTDEVLDSNIGGGFFYRFRWPWVLQTEFGASYTNYASQNTQSVLVAPVYAAFVYRLPFPFQLQTFIKLGGGAAYLSVRPVNRWGWDPILFAGLEFSLPVARKVRIGARFDYNLIYEKSLKPPPEIELLRYISTNQDPRFRTQENFRIYNGSFFHFGLMLSFSM